MTAGLDENKLGPRHLLSAVAGSVATAIVWLFVRPPGSPPQWMLLGLVSIAAGLVTTVIAVGLVRWLGTWWRWLRRRRRNQVRLLPLLSVATALALAGAATVVAAVVARPPAAVASCDPPSELRILAAPGRLATARELAGAYRRATAGSNHGCPTVSPYVYAVPSETAIDNLAEGWPPTALRDVGPRPDLWLPESTSDVDQVREGLVGGENQFRLGETVLIGSTPLVLAIADSAVPAEAAAELQGLTWDELVDAAVDRFEWPLVRPAPAASAVGELAVTALHRDPEAESDALRIERWISQSLDTGGYPLADIDTLLCRHRERDQPEAAGTALLITDQAVQRFNDGKPLAGSCNPSADSAGDADPLTAFTPTDTLTVDQPAVPLFWVAPPVPRAQTAAASYLQWLAGRGGRAALADAGLRVDVRRLAAPAEAEGAMALYQDVQRPGRVLLALDLSGSMAEPVDEDRTRFQVAVRGVEASLDQLGPQDEFGLWVFRDTSWGPPAAATGPLFQERSQAEATVAALPSLQPDGATPLYRTIAAGVRAVGQHDDLVTGLVVLTDGDDSEDDPQVEQQLAALDEDDGIRVSVVAIGEASCRIDVVAEVTRNTGGECVQADFDTLEAELVRLFAALWSS